MIIGAYFKDGRVLVAPLEQTVGLLNISASTIRRALDGKTVVRGVILTMLPNDTPHRIPEGSVKLK